MIKEDLEKLYRYQKQLEAVRFRPTLIIDGKHDAEGVTSIFGLIFIPYMIFSRDIIFNAMENDPELFWFYVFWLFLGVSSVFMLFKNLKNHINGIKKYKHSGIEHDKIDCIFKKYNKKITNKDFSYTAFGQNISRTNNLINHLKEVEKINNINKIKKREIVVS